MNKNKDQFKIVSALALVFELGFAIALPIILFLLLGRWVDSMLHTSPLFLLIGVIVGIAVAFISVFSLVQALIDEDT